MIFPGYLPDSIVKIALRSYRKIGQGQEKAAGDPGPQAGPVGYFQGPVEGDTGS